MMIPQKKLATVIVAGHLGKKAQASPSESYVSNEKPESDLSAAKRDAAERMLRAFKADDAASLSDAMTDFNALCTYGDEPEDDEGGSKEGFEY